MAHIEAALQQITAYSFYMQQMTYYCIAFECLSGHKNKEQKTIKKRGKILNITVVESAAKVSVTRSLKKVKQRPLKTKYGWVVE